MKTIELFEEKKLSIDDMRIMVLRDCQPYLNYVGNKNYLWRGMPLKSSYVKFLDDKSRFGIGSVRIDRHPRDTDSKLHEILNNYFKSKIGLPLRSTSLFVVPDKATAREFNFNVFAIFPIGNFHYAWSKIIHDATIRFQLLFEDEDLDFSPIQEKNNKSYLQLIKNSWKKFAIQNNIKEKDFKSYVENEIKEKLYFLKIKYIPEFLEYFIKENDFWLFDEGLKEAFNPQYREHEIMIVCDKYYCVRDSLLPALRL